MKCNNENYLYRKNAQGDITHILDNAGMVVAKYVYDAWGNHAILDANGTDLASGVGVLNPFRYRSYYYDEETDLYYLQTRYYDPEVGRFISQDDVSYLDPDSVNGLNLYAYCANNPVMNVDPTGRFVLSLNNNMMTAIGLTMVAIPALISGGFAIAAGISGATYLGIIGAGTFVAGIGSGLFASTEYQQAFTGENWMLNAGMSEDLYYGLMLTMAILATIGTISCVVLSSIGNLSSAVAKMNSLQKHPGRWKMVKQIISKATGRKFKGGISKYTNYVKS